MNHGKPLTPEAKEALAVLAAKNPELVRLNPGLFKELSAERSGEPSGKTGGLENHSVGSNEMIGKGRKGPQGPKREKKYGNKVTVDEQGRKFDSLKERRQFEEHVALYGERSVMRQVSFPIGKKRIRVDLVHIMERYADGSVRIMVKDSKGRITPEWAAKANHLKDAYGIEVKVI
jgi:hypothetical protein